MDSQPASQTDKDTDMTKQIAAFHNFANAHKSEINVHFPT
jgi:hypothetical protein